MMRGSIGLTILSLSCVLGSIHSDIRLPTHLKPELYKIELLPFIIPDNFTINGKLELTMLCEEESRNVTLHAKNLTLNEENIKLINLGNGKSISITEHEYDIERDFYIARLSENLIKGTKYQISINYTAKLKDNNFGFYQSVYKDQETGLNEYGFVI